MDLQLLAADPDVLMRAYPRSIPVADDLAEDFDTHLELAELCVDDGLITKAMYDKARAVDAKLSEMSDRHEVALWTQGALRHREEWRDVRRLAREALAGMGRNLEPPPPWTSTMRLDWQPPYDEEPLAHIIRALRLAAAGPSAQIRSSPKSEEAASWMAQSVARAADLAAQLRQRGGITTEQYAAIEAVDDIIGRIDDTYPASYTVEALRRNPDWETVRECARTALRQLGKSPRSLIGRLVGRP